MDWINQLIGFLIVLFVFFFPLLRRVINKRQKAKQPPQEREQEPVSEEEEPSIKYPSFPQPHSFSSPVSSHHLTPTPFEFHSRLEKKKTRRKRAKTQITPLESALKGKTFTQQMVVLSEVMKRHDSIHE